MKLETHGSYVMRLQDADAVAEEIKKLLRVALVKVRTQGQVMNASQVRSKVSVWRLDSPLSTDAALDEHARWLADALAPATTLLAQLGEKHYNAFHLAVGIDSDDDPNNVPEFSASRELIEDISKLSAALDIAFYDYRRHAADGSPPDRSD